MKNNEIQLLPDQYYHIYNHANGRENLFVKPDNYYFFLKRYAFFINPVAETYAYCLMPNHLHLLVKIRDTKQLQEVFQKKKQTDDELKSEDVPNFVSREFL